MTAQSRLHDLKQVALDEANSIVLMLVVGLDRTEKHLSTVTQSVMLDLQESMSRSASP